MVRLDAMGPGSCSVAPGSALRDGLDRILQANKGAIIVVGDGPELLNICSGGFILDAAFSPQRLSELAKMDGALILAPDASRIARANVHLVPDPSVPTTETGTRHRTAERVARSLGVPVIAVSEGQHMITVYCNDKKRSVRGTAALLDRANQALRTLQSYRQRLDRETDELRATETKGHVTVRAVVDVLQLAETMIRIGYEVDGLVTELGVEGRLVQLQLEEVLEDIRGEERLIIHQHVGADADAVMAGLDGLDVEELSDDMVVAGVLGLAGRGPFTNLVPDDQALKVPAQRTATRLAAT